MYASRDDSSRRASTQTKEFSQKPAKKLEFCGIRVATLFYTCRSSRSKSLGMNIEHTNESNGSG